MNSFQVTNNNHRDCHIKYIVYNFTILHNIFKISHPKRVQLINYRALFMSFRQLSNDDEWKSTSRLVFDLDQNVSRGACVCKFFRSRDARAPMWNWVIQVRQVYRGYTVRADELRRTRTWYGATRLAAREELMGWWLMGRAPTQTYPTAPFQPNDRPNRRWSAGTQHHLCPCFTRAAAATSLPSPYPWSTSRRAPPGLIPGPDLCDSDPVESDTCRIFYLYVYQYMYIVFLFVLISRMSLLRASRCNNGAQNDVKACRGILKWWPPKRYCKHQACRIRYLRVRWHLDRKAVANQNSRW